MERLEQALIKARDRRNNRSGEAFKLVRGQRPTAPVTYQQTLRVPLNREALARNLIVTHQVNHEVTDVFRSLRAQVLRRMARHGNMTLGITSVGAGEGKTTLALNLAIAISMDVNQTVLLVDADLRSPGIARALGINVTNGLEDVLAGRASVEECLINPGLERLCILPAHESIDNSAELLSSPQMQQLVAELKGRYLDRLVIFDLPPLLTVGDTLGFLPLIDSTLLVVRDGTVQEADLRRMTNLLREHNLIGTVLNAAA
jgi:protein-tyrosine kinase